MSPRPGRDLTCSKRVSLFFHATPGCQLIARTGNMYDICLCRCLDTTALLGKGACYCPQARIKRRGASRSRGPESFVRGSAHAPLNSTRLDSSRLGSTRVSRPKSHLSFPSIGIGTGTATSDLRQFVEMGRYLPRSRLGVKRAAKRDV